MYLVPKALLAQMNWEKDQVITCEPVRKHCIRLKAFESKEQADIYIKTHQTSNAGKTSVLWLLTRNARVTIPKHVAEAAEMEECGFAIMEQEEHDTVILREGDDFGSDKQ